MRPGRCSTRPRSLGIVEDIHLSIGYIVEDTAEKSFDEFMADRRSRQLVAHNLEIIGEAMNRLRREDLALLDRLSNPNPYIALRNVLIHGYDVIDYSITWNIVQKNLPTLNEEFNALIERGSP